LPAALSTLPEQEWFKIAAEMGRRKLNIRATNLKTQVFLAVSLKAKATSVPYDEHRH